MREEDEDVHPQAVARKTNAKTRLFGGIALGVAGIVLMFLGDAWVGMMAACIGFGILSVSDVKTLRG